MSDSTENPCPTCGKKNFPIWNEEGECITCARDRVLGPYNPPDVRNPRTSHELEARIWFLLPVCSNSECKQTPGVKFDYSRLCDKCKYSIKTVKLIITHEKQQAITEALQYQLDCERDNASAGHKWSSGDWRKYVQAELMELKGEEA